MTKQFWKAAGIRALKTFCQTAVAQIGGGAVGLMDINWATIASIAAISAILSILTSVATGLPEAEEKEEEKAA